MLRDNALEDDDEMNAVEYAIIVDAYMHVVKLLQQASQRVMKRETMKNQSSRASSQAIAVMARIRAHTLNSSTA